jgi:hypothetical protein
MSKSITVSAEQCVSYSCDCPNCGETFYSELTDSWDESEMIHYPQKIECDECDEIFYVSY